MAERDGSRTGQRGGLLRSIGVNRQVMALSTARMADAFCNSLLIVLLPLYVGRVPHAGVFAKMPDELLIGILISLAGLMFAIMQPLAASVSDHFGRRKPFILGGLAVLVVGTLGYIPADSFRALVGLRMLQGVGIAFTIPTALALISDYSETRTVGGSMGVFTTMRMVGFAIGPLAGGIIMETLGFNAAFVVAAAGAVLSMILVTLLVPEVRVDHERERQRAKAGAALAAEASGGGPQETDRWGNDRRVVRHAMRQLYVVGAAVFVMAVGISLIASVEPELNRRLGQTAVGFGAAFAALTVARFLTQIPLGHLSDTIGRKRLIVAGMAATVPLVVLQGFAPTTLLLSIDRFLLGVATAAIVAPGYALVADRALPGLKVRQMSVMTMSFGLGIAAGPILSGMLAGVVSFEMPFIAGGVLSMGATLLVALFVEESNPAVLNR